MKEKVLKKYISGVLQEARSLEMETPFEIEELLSVVGRRGVIHFASSKQYQANMVVGYSLHNNISENDIIDMCIHNQTKRYILVSVPDLKRNFSVIDVDNIFSLTNFIMIINKIRDSHGSIKSITMKSVLEAWDNFRVLKHFIKSPTSVIQFRFVHALRRFGIDVIKGNDPFGTKLVFIDPNIIQTIADLNNPFFRSNAGRPKNIDSNDNHKHEFETDDEEH